MSESGFPITCEDFAGRLMDLLEGDLDDATRAALEAHARRCDACGALLADLRRVQHDAARLPVLTPSHDLWNGVAERIAAPVVPLADRRRIWTSPRVLGFAAAAAIVLAAGLGYEVAAHRAVPGTAAPATAAPTRVATQPALPAATPASPAAPGGQTAAPAPDRGTAPGRAQLAANRAANATPAAVEQTYDTEIAGLRTIIANRHDQLDTATVAVLEHNLAVIDSAIAQCKTALTKDPHSQFLIQSLNQSLDTKVQLLRLTAGLPSAT